MDNYISSQSESIFRSVAVLIYVFDVESRDLERDYGYFQTCLESLMQNSKDAKVFCLVHKMDLVQQEDADKARCPDNFFTY
jgi:Ras-related GTP-binding protein A/B